MWLVHQPKSISPLLMWITLMISTFQWKPQKRRAMEKADSLSQTRRWVFNHIGLIHTSQGVTSADERWPENSGCCIDKSYWERSRLEDLSWCQVFSQGKCERKSHKEVFLGLRRLKCVNDGYLVRITKKVLLSLRRLG